MSQLFLTLTQSQIDIKFIDKYQLFNICQNTKNLSYADRLKQVFDITFPYALYQPMSLEFTNQSLYYQAVQQYIKNLETTELVCNMSTTTLETSIALYGHQTYGFQYRFQSSKETYDDLDTLQLFMTSHCPKNILIEFVRNPEWNSLNMNCQINTNQYEWYNPLRYL